MISPTQRPLPNSTQHKRLTRDFHTHGGIRTRTPSKRAAADPRLRPRENWHLAQESSYISHSLRMLGPCIFLSYMIWDSKKCVQLFDKECTIYRRRLNGDRIRLVRNVMFNHSHNLKFILGTTLCWKRTIGMWGDGGSGGREMLATCPTAELLQSQSLRHLVYIL
jgi:hypothetical protein